MCADSSGEVNERTLYVKWYRSGDIPEDWYPIESHTQPIETVKQLPEGEMPWAIDEKEGVT